jgi:hypothetical protein
MVAEEAEAEVPPIQWRDIPTVVVDGALTHATINELQRVTLAEFVFNEAPGATKPKLRPVVTLALTPNALKSLAQYLTELANKTDG